MRISLGRLIPVAIFASAGVSFADTTDDVISHFVSQDQVFQNDSLHQLRADINDDGFEDLLLSSTSERRQYPRGRVIWDYYLSDGKVGYLITDPGQSISMVLPKNTHHLVRLEQLDNRVALLSVSIASAAEGTLWAYYFDGDQLKRERLDDLQLKQVGTTPKNTEMYDRLIEQATVHTAASSSMQDILSEEAFNALPVDMPDREPDIFELNRFERDPNDPENFLVVDRVTGELIGTWKNGVLTPIEPERESVEGGIEQDGASMPDRF